MGTWARIDSEAQEQLERLGTCSFYLREISEQPRCTQYRIKYVLICCCFEMLHLRVLEGTWTSSSEHDSLSIRPVGSE